MAVVTKATLKSYFETNDQPTQAEFANLVDTLVNINPSASYFSAGDTGSIPLRVGDGTGDYGYVSSTFNGILTSAGTQICGWRSTGAYFGVSSEATMIVYETVSNWDMDSTDTVQVDLSSYLMRTNVRDIAIVVVSDAGSVYDGSRDDGVRWFMLSTDTDGIVTLSRQVGGFFDNSNFDSPTGTRCYLKVTYRGDI